MGGGGGGGLKSAYVGAYRRGQLSPSQNNFIMHV